MPKSKSPRAKSPKSGKPQGAASAAKTPARPSRVPQGLPTQGGKGRGGAYQPQPPRPATSKD
ncbi:hypothetical protein ACXN5S_12260 [Pseudoroseicyclus sp. H15]